MLDSPLVEIGLGLAFVFALFSLLVSAANEIIVALFKSRAVSLWDGIGMLLNGDDKLREAFFAHPLIQSLTPPKSWGGSITSDRRSGPSYIEARTFAVALLHLLKEPHQVLDAIEAELTRAITELRAGNTSGLGRVCTALGEFGKQMPDSPFGNDVRQQLQQLQQQLTDKNKPAAEMAQSVSDALQVLPERWRTALTESPAAFVPGLEGTIKAIADDAAGNIEKFRLGIEHWFDEGMDIVSGWYKRWTQAIQLGLGLVLAIALNVDTVNIVQVLNANDELRRELAARAVYAGSESVQQRHGDGQDTSGIAPVSVPDAESQFQDIKTRLEQTGLPLGWENTKFGDYLDKHGLFAALGWILTALAASLGAPFWFDLLKKAANLRAAGPNPDEKKATRNAA